MIGKRGYLPIPIVRWPYGHLSHNKNITYFYINISNLYNAAESFKSKLIENVLEEILKDPELLKKFRNEIK